MTAKEVEMTRKLLRGTRRGRIDHGKGRKDAEKEWQDGDGCEAEQEE